MNLMWRYAKKYKNYIFLNFLCVFSFILIELGLPTLLARIIDKGLVPKDFEVVKTTSVWMLAVCFAGLIGLILLAFCGSKISTSVIRDMRDDAECVHIVRLGVDNREILRHFENSFWLICIQCIRHFFK